jgi:hypothetical protein
MCELGIEARFWGEGEAVLPTVAKEIEADTIEVWAWI